MNVQASNLALVFGPQAESGKVVRVLWPFDVSESLGYRWVVRIWDEGDCVVPDSSLMALDIDPTQDSDARELLDPAGRAAWDRWSTGPNVKF